MGGLIQLLVMTSKPLATCYYVPEGNTVNGRGLIIAIASVGVGLGMLIVSLHQTTSVAIQNVQSEVHVVRNDTTDLRERMARMESRMETLESRMETLESGMVRMDARMETIEGRFGTMERLFAGRLEGDCQ